MGAWDPKRYLSFGGERTRPALDLALRVDVDDPRTVVDLGCGPGNSTEILRERWPEAAVLGVDSSPSMIAAAKEGAPGERWEIAEIEVWAAEEPSGFDVVFSNAAMQWVRNHEKVVPALFGRVRPGGALAFQIPSDRYALVREVIRRVADDPEWAGRMSAANSALTMERPEAYYDMLAPFAASLDVWETECVHVMQSHEAIVEWISTTGMRPYLDALDTDDERARFGDAVTAGVREAYSARVDGKVLFPFRRLFVVARAAGAS